MSKLISVGQLIDRSWEHYHKNFPALMSTAAWIFVPIVLVTICGMFIPTGDSADTWATMSSVSKMFMLLAAVIGIVGIPLTMVIVNMNLFNVIDEQAKGRVPKLDAIAKINAKRLPWFLIMTVIRWVLTTLPLLFLAPGLILIILNLFSQGSIWLGSFSILLTFVGTILALLGVIYVGVVSWFSGAGMIVDRQGVIDSISHSIALVRGRFWMTFFNMLVPKFLVGIIILVVQIALSITTSLLFASMASLSDSALILAANLVASLISTGIIVLTTPLYVLVDYYLYGSLKESK